MHTVIFETPSKNQQYQVMVDWENIEEKPNGLVTPLDLASQGYINKQ
jgi:hypothetical protein